MVACVVMTLTRRLAASPVAFVLVLASACPDEAKAPPPQAPPPQAQRTSTPTPTLPAGAQVDFERACSDLRAMLTREFAVINAACKVPADCAIYDMQYNPCDPPLAFARTARRDVELFEDTLDSAREYCRLDAGACPTPPDFRADCEAGKCVVKQGKAVPEFFTLLSSATASGTTPLASVRVKVELVRQPNCITAPCPAMQLGELNLQTDPTGLLRIALGDANAAILSVEGHEPTRVWIKANDGPNDVPTPYALKKKP